MCNDDNRKYGNERVKRFQTKIYLFDIEYTFVLLFFCWSKECSICTSHSDFFFSSIFSSVVSLYIFCLKSINSILLQISKTITLSSIRNNDSWLSGFQYIVYDNIKKKFHPKQKYQPMTHCICSTFTNNEKRWKTKTLILFLLLFCIHYTIHRHTHTIFVWSNFFLC